MVGTPYGCRLHAVVTLGAAGGRLETPHAGGLAEGTLAVLAHRDRHHPALRAHTAGPFTPSAN